MAEHDRLPKEMRKLLATLTYKDKLRKFRHSHEREPDSDEELEDFVVELARELYNAEYDEWPENDEELE
jgi:hypothetical protein